MNIVVLDGAIANPGDLSWAGLEKLGRVTVYDTTAPAQCAERLQNAEVAITNKVPLGREVFEACPRLRYIGLLSTGYNVIDLAAASERGIPVCNVPGYSTDGVAQHTIALLLEITNRVGHHSEAVRAGRWQESLRWSFWDHPLMELRGKTFGAIGFGSIGKAAGRIAAALGMRVLASGSRPTEEGRAIGEYVSREELLAQADVVSLHCPLLPETKGMINRQTISAMKDGAILLNTARGGLLVEQDVADALGTGKLLAAGLDVMETEPPKDSPLQTASNCFITPHIAWVAKETRERLMDIVEDNLRRYLAGTPVNVVNPL